MSQFKDYFSTESSQYRQFRPSYPDCLYDYLADLCTQHDKAWDVGCGNGQASVALARRFAQVEACDGSAKQVEHAPRSANISYQVCPAEAIRPSAESVDLLVVAQAIHWFDHATFFKIVKRALKPGGVLACWGYQFLYTDSPLDPLIKQFHSEKIGSYWPPERHLINEGYQGIAFPFPAIDTPTFHMETSWSFAQLIGYLCTWSAVKQYELTHGRNPVQEEINQLREAWGNPQEIKRVYWPLILYAGKKSI